VAADYSKQMFLNTNDYCILLVGFCSILL